MLMAAAATHMVGSAHSTTSSSISPPPPWHPVLLVPNHDHRQQQHHHDLDLATPSPSPTPTTPAATASPPRHNHLLRPAASHSRQRAGKPRRPRRPSRKLPTTYITADAASFRRMVHQVTGADDALLPGPGPGPGNAAPAPPSRGALTTTKTTTLTLPTLDTSAFLLGAADRGGAPPARPGVSCCHGSAALQVKAEDCGGGGGGFPSLESWDEDDALF